MRVLLTLWLVLATGPTQALAAMHCLEPPYLSDGTAKQNELAEIHSEIVPVLNRYPSLDEALAAILPDFCLSSQKDDAYAFLDVENNRIVISEGLDSAMKIGVLLHELRHLWQFAHDACPSDAMGMKDYARAVFAIEADASAISLLMAWEMKDRGQGAVWGALAAWPTQSDIAARFAETMTASGNMKMAVISAFRQWYVSPTRRATYYASSCGQYLDRQDANHALPRYEPIPDGFFDRLCKLPDGTDYDCTVPDFRQN